MNRPVFTYGLRLPYHSPADMARKIRLLKLSWFVLPVVLGLGNGSFWTDPYNPSGPKSFQWEAVFAVLITWTLGLVAYFAIRWMLKLRAKPIVNTVSRQARPDRGAGILQSPPHQLPPHQPRNFLS
jgi:hypothetical protein